MDGGRGGVEARWGHRAESWVRRERRRLQGESEIALLLHVKGCTTWTPRGVWGCVTDRHCGSLGELRRRLFEAAICWIKVCTGENVDLVNVLPSQVPIEKSLGV